MLENYSLITSVIRMKDIDIWNKNHDTVWKEILNLTQKRFPKQFATSELLGVCKGVGGRTDKKSEYLSLPRIHDHLHAFETEGRIEYHEGSWRIKPVMKKGLLPKELPKEFKEALTSIDRREGEYSYGQEELGGIFVFAPSMPVARSDIINYEFLFSDPYWLKEIFTHGLREGMISEDRFKSLHKFTDNELYNVLRLLWNDLFGNCECFVTIFWFNPQKLLKFLQTEEGRNFLKEIFREDVQNNILKSLSFRKPKVPKAYLLRTRRG